MEKIVLSIIIPTYDRPELVYKLLNQIIQFQSKELEIVICDDNPSSDRTQKALDQIKDPRIKYFRNKKNLGYDLNFIMCAKRAKGEYIYILCDDDEIEMKSIPWIIKNIKSNKGLSQICGTIGNDLFNQDKIFKYFGNRYLTRGYNSLKELLFYYSHGVGIVLRRSALNLKHALKYNGFLYMQQVFIAQALIGGDTLCTSRIFGYAGESNTLENSDQPLFKEKRYNNPVYRLYQSKFRIELLFEIIREIGNSKEIRKILLNREKKRIYRFLNDAFSISFKSFIESLSLIISNPKVSRLPIFWIELLIELVFFIFIRKLEISKNKIFRYIIFQIIKFFDAGRLKVSHFSKPI